MKKILNQTTKTAPGLGLWFRRVILAWLTAAAAEFWLLPKELRDLSGLDGIAQMSGLRMILITAMVLILVSVLERVISGGVQRWLILVAFGALAAAACGANAAVPFLAVCMLVLAVLLVYAVRGWNGAEEKRRSIGTEKGCGVVTAVLTVAFFLLVSLWTVCRVYSFSTPSYDFSIFAQMFHSMRTTGLPMTTIERDGPLSHFAVHVSPIYYVLLPFYSLWPRPEMLQILQAAVLASGVLPLWLLGKRHGLCPLVRSLVCLMLLLYPAYAGGASYDIHENAFLTPLLLWLFYAMDRIDGKLTKQKEQADFEAREGALCRMKQKHNIFTGFAIMRMKK